MGAQAIDFQKKCHLPCLTMAFRVVSLVRRALCWHVSPPLARFDFRMQYLYSSGLAWLYMSAPARSCQLLPTPTDFFAFQRLASLTNICTIAIPVSIFLPSWEPQVSIQPVPQSQPDLVLVIGRPNLFKYRWLADLTTFSPGGAFGGP